MKQFFTEREHEMIRESHHGGLKFILFKGEEKVKTFYRVTISGGLDYANGQVDKEEKDESIYTIRVYDKKGMSSRSWRKVGYVQRKHDTNFVH